jgi:hypothetical protein
MRWPATLAVAALAESLAYFLSLTWGFMALLLAFAVVSTRMAATGAKAYTTEARINAILPVLGQHLTLISAAQSAANGAQSTANTANTSANNAQGTANNAQSTANEAIGLADNGGTINGDLHVNGNFFSTGNVNCPQLYSSGDGHVGGNFFSAGTVNSSGQTASGGDLHANAAFYIEGQRIAAPQPRATGLTTAGAGYTQAWGNSIVSFCTAVNTALINAGVCSP